MTEEEAAEIRKLAQTVKAGLLDFAATSEAMAEAGEKSAARIRGLAVRTLQMPADQQTKAGREADAANAEFSLSQMELAESLDVFIGTCRHNAKGAREVAAKL